MKRFLSSALVLSVVAPAFATSQVVQGLAADRATGELLSSVKILLFDPNGAPLDSVMSGEGGIYFLRFPESGSYFVGALRIGYEPYVSPVMSLADSLTYDLSLQLKAAAISLDAIDVTAEAGGSSTRLSDAGFYSRREEGFGDFLTREDFEEWNPQEAVDIVRRLSGFRVTRNPSMYGPRWFIRSKRSANRRALAISGSASRCPPLIFLDGVFVGNTETADIDMVMTVSELGAVEAYPGSSRVPARFNLTGSNCGVLVFWSR